MRVLFTTWASPSHLFPMVPLAWAFQAAGHEVRVAVPPNCTAHVSGAGLTPVAIGPVPGAMAGSGQGQAKGQLKVWHSQRSWPADWPLHLDRLDEGQLGLLQALVDRQAVTAEAMVPELLEFARHFGPDLIVRDAGTYAAAVVADLLGVPLASHQWGSPAVLDVEHSAPGGEAWPGYRALFEKFGAQADDGTGVFVDPCPPSLQLPTPATRLNTRIVSYNGPGELPDWLRKEPEAPRVCITWGVTAGKLDPKSALPAPLLGAAHSLAAAGLEVVLAVTEAQRELLGELPSGIRTVSMLPLHLLLPTCAAVAHQGGGGTAMTAVAAGTPQLILSPRPEQMLTGDRLTGAGAARHVPYNELIEDERAGQRVHEDVLALVEDPAHRDAAARLREESQAQPSPARTAERLLELVR
ncbi:nucleotide disphospho-sugar-binding domain-containing protein [Kitasatospora sp. NPDC004615]|uniref:nucleotide disphospho-sugar-binding domain-containing protein n=1 Tax=unclassified Kitasatospora TaxID=2633591 RepID=UPI0036B05C68